jgi:hypothetical protein
MANKNTARFLLAVMVVTMALFPPAVAGVGQGTSPLITSDTFQTSPSNDGQQALLVFEFLQPIVYLLTI